jgi:hypothetical protein
MSILVQIFVMMHSISCLWLLIGETFDNSWIKKESNGLNSVYGIVWDDAT